MSEIKPTHYVSGGVINPEAFYDDGGVYAILKIPRSTLAKARSKKLLRYVKVGNQLLYRGQWIIDWIENLSEGKK